MSNNKKLFRHMVNDYVDEMQKLLPSFPREAVFLTGNQWHIFDYGFIIYNWRDSGMIWICQLYIKPEYRRTGAARKLMRMVELECKIKNGVFVSLRCLKNNINAQKFYESLGYVQSSDDILHNEFYTYSKFTEEK